jgi:hypothetical protein
VARSGKKSAPEFDPLNTPLFEKLAKQLEEQPGKLHQLPISADDIGGELISILSKGLYTNPLDCVREYIQNAVDADAKNVRIKITGNSVTIFDNGQGMSLENLLEARSFGLSPKSISQYVGFRGIGLYSGFDICRELLITSKRGGKSDVNSIKFNFAEMKEQLNQDKQKESTKEKVSLIKLLSDHTYIKRETSSYPLEVHFTQVQLSDLEDTHVKKLSDRKELRAYLLNNLPIDFDDEFEYKEEINKNLYRSVPGFKAIKIVLQSDDQPDEVVVKDKIPDLQSPQFDYIETPEGKRLAYLWGCLNKERQKINNNFASKLPDEKADSYEGFVYKVKGFTIGDRQKLRRNFTMPHVYGWWTGEVYVLDDEIVPNAERNDFETSLAKQSLEIEVRKKLRKLQEVTLKFQREGNADEKISALIERVDKINQQIIDNTSVDNYQLYSDLDDILEDFQQYQKDASRSLKEKAKVHIKKVNELMEHIRKQAEKRPPESKKRKKASKDSQKSLFAVPTVSASPSQPSKTIIDLLTEADWELDNDVKRLAELIQTCLDDTISKSSEIYSSFFNDLEARLFNDG